MRVDLRNRKTTVQTRATRRVKWQIRPYCLVAFYADPDADELKWRQFGSITRQMGIDSKGRAVWPDYGLQKLNPVYVSLIALPTGDVQDAQKLADEILIHMNRPLTPNWAPPTGITRNSLDMRPNFDDRVNYVK